MGARPCKSCASQSSSAPPRPPYAPRAKNELKIPLFDGLPGGVVVSAGVRLSASGMWATSRSTTRARRPCWSASASKAADAAVATGRMGTGRAAYMASRLSLVVGSAYADGGDDDSGDDAADLLLLLCMRCRRPANTASTIMAAGAGGQTAGSCCGRQLQRSRRRNEGARGAQAWEGAKAWAWAWEGATLAGPHAKHVEASSVAASASAGQVDFGAQQQHGEGRQRV